MTDTYLDGGGVLPDEPLPVGTWIRINAGPPNAAITIHADSGGVRIAGHYLPIDVYRVAPNEVRVTASNL